MSSTTSTKPRASMKFEIWGSCILNLKFSDDFEATGAITLAKTLPNRRKLSLIHYDNPERAHEPAYWSPGWPEDWTNGLPNEMFSLDGRNEDIRDIRGGAA